MMRKYVALALCWFFILYEGHHHVSCQVSYGMRKLAYSTNQFGLDLMRSMDRSDTNMAFCPFCISSSLAMMLSGAQGSTSTSLRHALYLWGMNSDEINVIFYDMINHLGMNVPSFARSFSPTSVSTTSAATSTKSYIDQHHHPAKSPVDAVDVTVLTNMYVQRDIPMAYHYHMTLQRFFRTVLHPVDFHFNGEETRQHINAIVERQTNHKIQDILPTRVSPSTQLLLLSALYFKGNLDITMNPLKTPEPFSLVSPRPTLHMNYIHKLHHPLASPQDSFKISAPATLMMQEIESLSSVFGDQVTLLEAKNATIRYQMNRQLNCTVVEMPFKESLVTLLLVMPGDANGLDLLLTKLSAQVLIDLVNSMQVKRVNLRVRKEVN